jgi:hypothetical protein
MPMAEGSNDPRFKRNCLSDLLVEVRFETDWNWDSFGSVDLFRAGLG